MWEEVKISIRCFFILIKELKRQEYGLELIASENYVSKAVYKLWEVSLLINMLKDILEKILWGMRICR